ncbi:hypothetical protein PGT21_005879 [Puccinia graminis f. sp. tritici]|uniref:Uncharacterized protein n=1 Tax=Puccinia graminis f. sp. tritici TaxID=56615 RepID=A0A5B0LNJ7_PUCGR|nr:hypothetical protein PGT21_005879 [Puccinia graminis f. sp. tritici]
MKPRKLNQETRSRMPRFFLLWGIIFLHPKPRDDEGEQYKTLFSYARESQGSRSIVSRRNPNKTTVSGGHGGSQERLNLPVLYFV